MGAQSAWLQMTVRAGRFGVMILMLYALGVFLGFAVLERVASGYAWPHEPWWVLRGLFWFGANLAVGHYASVELHDLVAHHTLIDLHFLGLWAALPALFVYELLTYGFHRALHAHPVLWRVHQLHHSSERIDVWSTWRSHPFEQVVYTASSVLVSVGVMGTTSGAAFLVSIVLLLVGHLQHSNLRTPRWLGYWVARPENHMLHHARGAHVLNYSDFPVIDMLFGTFALPEEAPRDVGFWDGASRRVVRMIGGVDVTMAPQSKECPPKPLE